MCSYEMAERLIEEQGNCGCWADDNPETDENDIGFACHSCFVRVFRCHAIARICGEYMSDSFTAPKTDRALMAIAKRYITPVHSNKIHKNAYTL